jgi:hypothetical protein
VPGELIGLDQGLPETDAVVEPFLELGRKMLDAPRIWPSDESVPFESHFRERRRLSAFRFLDVPRRAPVKHALERKSET